MKIKKKTYKLYFICLYLNEPKANRGFKRATPAHKLNTS